MRIEVNCIVKEKPDFDAVLIHTTQHMGRYKGPLWTQIDVSPTQFHFLYKDEKNQMHKYENVTTESITLQEWEEIKKVKDQFELIFVREKNQFQDKYEVVNL